MIYNQSKMNVSLDVSWTQLSSNPLTINQVSEQELKYKVLFEEKTASLKYNNLVCPTNNNHLQWWRLFVKICQNKFLMLIFNIWFYIGCYSAIILENFDIFDHFYAKLKVKMTIKWGQNDNENDELCHNI